VMAGHPTGDVRPPRLMGAVYEEILRRMETAGWAPPRKRVRLPKTKLLGIVIKNGLRA
jgi:presqualene diphosphate synthase